MKHIDAEECPWQIIESHVEYKGRRTVLKDRLKVYPRPGKTWD